MGEARVFTAEPVCSWAAYLFTTRLRDRGCSAHPAFPAPSSLEEGQRNANLGRIARRDREVVSRPINVIARNEATVMPRNGVLRFARKDGVCRCPRSDDGAGRLRERRASIEKASRRLRSQ